MPLPKDALYFDLRGGVEMKPANVSYIRQRRAREGGQTITLVLLALALFLLAAVGIAVDISNWWFHRQIAQGAADAACTAGIMDMLVNDSQGTSFGGFPSPLATYKCSDTGASASAPCAYANLNGYSGAGLVAGQPSNDVQVMFPTSLSGSGLKVCSSTVPPPCIPATIGNPFLVVNVFDRVPTTFTGLVRGSTTVDVAASAACVITYASAPIPILVLDPQNPNVKPAVSALNVQGTPVISIVGGPQKSIQVNTADSGKAGDAVTVGGNAKIDLHLGGPAGPPGTGSDIGIFGAVLEPSVTKNFDPGTTGHWEHGAPVSDPFAQICAPGQATDCMATINGFAAPAIPTAGPAVPADLAGTCTATGIPCALLYHNAVHGCPDPAGCYLYTPGICVGTGSCANKKYTTAVFDPGLYYLTAGLTLNPGSNVRPSTVTTGYGGTFFYFAGSSTITVDSNSGKPPYTTDPFNTSALPCAAGSTIPTNLQGITLQGNILLGPCTGYYGDPLGTAEPVIGEQRQFLFFQDRSAENVNPSWGGGGQFLLAGTMYFHSCNASGTGVNCGAVGTYWNDTFTMNGNSGSGTYVLGEIVTDNLILGGTSGITMDLNPNSAYPILKATLIQ
jgi:hypothetical protein